MKNIFKSGVLSVVFATILAGCISIHASAQPVVSGTITYQTFYDNLSPYGTWIDYPGYGNVWSPQIDGDFRPYATNGYWIYSPEGWAWESNYEWGWAPFHYGRWIYDDNYGWLWVPGYDWSPAWVTWGFADDYYCWAPLMPEVNVIAEFGRWRPHSFYWNVCRREHIYDRDLGHVIERPDHVANIVDHITVINNFNTTRRNKLYYSKGPDVNEVTRYTGQKINPVSYRDVTRANMSSHKGNIVNVYRPAVQVPQPREFRKVETDQVKPIRNNDQKPMMQREEQRNNVQHLPVHRVENNFNRNPNYNTNPTRVTNNPGRKH